MCKSCVFQILLSLCCSSIAQPSSNTNVQDTPRAASNVQEQAPAATPAAGCDQAESVLLMGEDYNTMVKNIMDMGYVQKDIQNSTIEYQYLHTTSYSNRSLISGTNESRSYKHYAQVLTILIEP